jgi:hypothetical protein
MSEKGEIIQLVDDYFHQSINQGDGNIIGLLLRTNSIDEASDFDPRKLAPIYNVKDYQSYQGFELGQIGIDILEELKHIINNSFSMDIYDGEVVQVEGTIKFGSGEARLIKGYIIFSNNKWELGPIQIGVGS